MDILWCLFSPCMVADVSSWVNVYSFTGRFNDFGVSLLNVSVQVPGADASVDSPGSLTCPCMIELISDHFCPMIRSHQGNRLVAWSGHGQCNMCMNYWCLHVQASSQLLWHSRKNTHIFNNVMQPCRTLPRPLTPISLLDSVCWVVTDAPTAAQVYTNSSGSVVLENGLEAENGHDNEHDHHGRSHGRDHEQSHRPNGNSEKEIFTRPLSER